MIWPWDFLWYTYKMWFDLFLEYPITLLSLLGIPAGAYIYFKMYPEDLQKVKDFLHI
jgi:hypothetical protein